MKKEDGNGVVRMGEYGKSGCFIETVPMECIKYTLFLEIKINEQSFRKCISGSFISFGILVQFLDTILNHKNKMNKQTFRVSQKKIWVYLKCW